jgi:hypothetical protein
MKMFSAISIAAVAAVSAASPAASTTIDFTGFSTGATASPIVYPEATFTSSTGRFFVGAAGLANEICPYTVGGNCSASMTVLFSAAVDGLTFETSGYDGASNLFVSGIGAGGAFATSFNNGGGFDTLFIDLTAFSGITSLSLSTDDPAGVAYNAFTFQASGAVPEPASWALMIAGAGVAGGAVRRRSSVKTSISFA